MSVIVKVVILLPSEITRFPDQVRMKLISQLIKSISRLLYKLHKYINGTAIFVSITFDFNLNDSEFVILLSDSSLQIWYELPDIFEYLLLYSFKLRIDIITFKSFAFST